MKLQLVIKSNTWKFLTLILLLLIFSPAVISAPLTDFSGNEKSIKDYQNNGKWLVVMLWASDCHVCNQEAHVYEKFHQQHAAKDAQMLGVSLDGKAKFSDAQDFIKRHKLSFPNLIGEPESVAAIYTEVTGSQWVGTPTFLVYNPQGELLGAQVGAVPPKIIEGFIERESTTAKQKIAN